MDSAYLTTFAGLAGAIIGGLTSFASTWLTTTSQTRAARLAAEQAARQDLYGRFLDELATLYADALNNERVDNAKLVGIFALRGRITLMSAAPVIACAERAVKFLVDLAMAPRRSDAEVRAMMDDEKLDIIGQFARACRAELQDLR